MARHDKITLDVPRVMLMNSGDPSANGIGEVFLNGMLAEYPRDRLVRFSTMLGPSASSPTDWNGSLAYLDTVPYSAVQVYSSWLDRRYRKKQLSDHVQQTLALIEKHGVDLLWIILNHPTTIHLAHALISVVRIPIVAQVWDSPEYLIQCRRLSGAIERLTLASFAEVLHQATHVVSISPGMTEIYRDRYGVNSTPMVFCPPAESWMPAKDYVNTSSNDTSVIFAGSLYAWREWDSFLDAVEWRNRSSTSQYIRVTCMGNQSRWARKHKWVRYIKHQPMAQATDAVHAADVAYLPYWQDAKHAYVARTSFPSKLPFYLAAGVPILYHGPRDSTPAAFLEKYPVGVCCHTHQRADILAALDTCTRGRDFLRQYPKARQDVFNEVLNPALMASLFLTILGNVSNATKEYKA